MPWYGFWGGAAGGLCWLMPLFGLAFMALMLFFCARGMGRWRSRPWMSAPWVSPPPRSDGDLSELKREVASLRDELRKLRDPN